ncbi:transposase [Prescottella defluvii]|nr:transposase [Prescottella defluvii]
MEDPNPPGRGARRQGLLVESDSHPPPVERHRSDHRRTGRPEASPPPAGRPRRPSGRVRHRECKGRNVVERSFATLKQWRGLATRYDKLALTYRAGVVLSAVCIWLRSLTK